MEKLMEVEEVPAEEHSVSYSRCAGEKTAFYGN